MTDGTLTPAVATRDIPLGALVESPLNARKTYDKDSLKEMGANLKANGQIHPALVRPTSVADGTDAWEIVAGSRRFRAAPLAGMTHLRCEVRNLTDDEVLAIVVAENDQREALPPMDDAEALQRLVVVHGTAEKVAKVINRSVSTVYRRLRLLDMVPAARKALAKGDITLEHAFIIGRLPAVNQAAALEEVAEGATPANLREWVKDRVLTSLKGVPWRLDDAALVPAAGPCTTCPKRIGNALALFGDITTDKDTCGDGACFEGKRDAVLRARFMAALALPHPVDCGATWLTTQFHRKPKVLVEGPLMDAYAVRRLDTKTKCNATRAYVMMDGRDAGVTGFVCTARDCTVHAPKGDRTASLQGSGTYERDQRKKQDRERAIRTAVLAQILKRKHDATATTRAAVSFMWRHLGGDVRNAICRAHGWKREAGFVGDKTRKAQKDFPDGDAVVDKLKGDAQITFMVEVMLSGTVATTYGSAAELYDTAKRLRIDVDAIRKTVDEARKAKPRPAKKAPKAKTKAAA